MLVPCPECKAEISDKAITCPKCGVPRAAPLAPPASQFSPPAVPTQPLNAPAPNPFSGYTIINLVVGIALTAYNFSAGHVFWGVGCGVVTLVVLVRALSLVR
jgi:hypothetical protein